MTVPASVPPTACASTGEPRPKAAIPDKYTPHNGLHLGSRLVQFDQQRQRRHGRITKHPVDEQALPVGRQFVGDVSAEIPLIERSAPEHHGRRAALHLTAEHQWNGDEIAVGRDVDQFLPVMPPARRDSSSGLTPDISLPRRRRAPHTPRWPPIRSRRMPATGYRARSVPPFPRREWSGTPGFLVIAKRQQPEILLVLRFASE